jgi:RNA polymerase sigma-70 factor (ECF subfamily)
LAARLKAELATEAVIPTRSERELVDGMVAGDEQCIQELVDRHGSMLYSLVSGILGNAADAEEVIADVYVQAWRTAARFDPARGTVLAWLVTIARTRALDRLRSRGRQSRTNDRLQTLSIEPQFEPVASATDAADRGVETGETRQLVQQALELLPDVQRTVIELAYFRGLSQSEIATQLAIPLGTVKTRTLAAMQRLRRALLPLLGEDVA